MANPLVIDAEIAHALLAWQVELGADEPVGDVTVNRYALAEPPVATAVATVRAAVRAAVSVPADVAATASATDPVTVAEAAARGAGTLEELAAAQAGYDLCEIRKGARSFVFADGQPGAHLMVIGEAPGRDEDVEGRPFVGRAGQLLDRMLAAIGLGRGAHNPAEAVYITNVMPWRPPSNRDPEPGEIAMMLPFLRRHVELAAPRMLVLMGNTPCAAVLGTRGILRLRGNWATGFGLPVMPMTHPAYLLRTPAAKREAWADLLDIRARLREQA